MQVVCPEMRDGESSAKPRTRWAPPLSNLKSRYRFGDRDRVDQHAVEVEGCSGYTLPRRGGRVVECGGLENRYVGNPGVGGSNPPLSALSGSSKNQGPDTSNLTPLTPERV